MSIEYIIVIVWCVCACVRVCARACVFVCVCARAYACVYTMFMCHPCLLKPFVLLERLETIVLTNKVFL